MMNDFQHPVPIFCLSLNSIDSIMPLNKFAPEGCDLLVEVAIEPRSPVRIYYTMVHNY